MALPVFVSSLSFKKSTSNFTT